MKPIVALGFTLGMWATAAVADDVSSCNAVRGQASIKACGRILANGGNSEQMGRAHFKRGLALSKVGDDRRALADFTSAARLMPGDADARHNVAITKLRLGDTEGGKRDLRQQARSGPNAERADRTSRTLDALDDYDAQIARRQRELEAEMRALDRASTTRR